MKATLYYLGGGQCKFDNFSCWSIADFLKPVGWNFGTHPQCPEMLADSDARLAICNLEQNGRGFF